MSDSHTVPTEEGQDPDPLFHLEVEVPVDIAEKRARVEAARCIQMVSDGYTADANRASSAGLARVAALYWAIVRELDRASKIALTGEDPGDGGAA